MHAQVQTKGDFGGTLLVIYSINVNNNPDWELGST